MLVVRSSRSDENRRCPLQQKSGRERAETVSTYPPRKTVHERPRYDCANAGLEEGFAERSWIGNEDADVFHQPGGGQGPEYVAESDPSEGEGSPFRPSQGHAQTQHEEGVLIASPHWDFKIGECEIRL